jgi:hypothetical protein
MDKALLVGINSYPEAPLAGCLNDVEDMALFITGKCGFDPAAVRLLTDSRATATTIKNRLFWLVDGLKPGDRILFQYSGHGAQVPTRDKKGEVDGLDEVVCCQNFDWSDSNMIRDKEFNTIFKRVPPGVAAWWISDSCHSGGLDRDMAGFGGSKPRRLIPPLDIRWRFEGVRSKGLEKNPLDVPNIALISGCRADQTAADAVFKKRPNGALTRFLLDALLRPDGLEKPTSQVITEVRAALKKNHFNQVPQLEGPADLIGKPFLH